MHKTHPLFNLVIIACIAFGGVLVAQFIGLGIAVVAYDIDLNQLQTVLSNPSKKTLNVKQIFWIVQGASLLVGMGGGAFLYQKWVARQSFSDLSQSKNLTSWAIGLTFLIFVFSIPITSEIMRWNKDLHFGSFDSQIREMENQAKVITEIITQMDSFGEMLVVLFVIAFIPAFAEEYLFRGLVQNEFLRWFRNSHIAVWVTAVIFSAIHFQFLGFFPRMFLGVLLGYLYVWSGSIIYPMIGHFCNNGLQVLALYLYQRNLIGKELTEEDYPVPLPVLIFSVAVLAGLLFYARKRFQAVRAIN